MDSDLPYVRAGNSLERSNPVTGVTMRNWTDRSGTVAVAGQAFELFAQADETVIERFVANVHPDGSLWINFLGGQAGANAPGSIEILPGDVFPIPTRGPVSAWSATAGLAYTAGQA